MFSTELAVKFQQLSAFEKHLEKASPDHLSYVYLVVAACGFERKKICETVCSAIRKKEKKIAVLTFDGAQHWAKASEELSTIFSLDGHRVVILDEADKLKKNALEALSAYIVKPSPYVYLLLSAASAKAFSEIYEKGKKELIVCDLSGEKPWDRKDRLRAYLVKMAVKDKKAITREASDMLLERIGTELAPLEQEMNKLICYCAARPQITAQDVQALCHSEKTATVWHLAEAIVWQRSVVRVEPSFETSSLLHLLGQIRSHLQQGMLIAVGHHGPLSFFKPQLLEKITPVAQARKGAFFTEALTCVFDMEMLAKNSSMAPSLLADLLIAKIHLLKKKYDLSFA